MVITERIISYANLAIFWGRYPGLKIMAMALLLITFFALHPGRFGPLFRIITTMAYRISGSCLHREMKGSFSLPIRAMENLNKNRFCGSLPSTDHRILSWLILTEMDIRTYSIPAET